MKDKRIWSLPGLDLPLGAETLLMGILNVTPDSFSDGGQFFDPQDALAQGRAMMDAGAKIIDVGGESTRPGSDHVSSVDEIARILPVIQGLQAQGALISVDTYKADVAAAAMAGGAKIINDIYGLMADREMAQVAKVTGAGLILMNHPVWYRPEHPCSLVFPKRPQVEPAAPELVASFEGLTAREACLRFLSLSIERALQAGVRESQIVLDPGIGFGLTNEENLSLVEHLDELQRFGYPILLAVSRKRFIRAILGEGAEMAERGTAAVGVWGVARGADMLRVHDVARQMPYIKVADALYRVDQSREA